jgi:tRNA nucleotidyltransferase (CCA-adding enzyme)
LGGERAGSTVRDAHTQGARVLERVRRLPGGPELLELARGRDDVELVGGATRDLLLGQAPRELDVVVGEGAARFAGELSRALGVGEGTAADTSSSERFGTAAVVWGGGRVDVATRRAETYPAAGALPDVREGTVQEDLVRRDFTVNAIAVGLGGAGVGRLRAAPRALEDLAAGRLRVMHERSFLDDPTRLLRLARYLARLGFQPERHTAALAAAATAGGALATVSRARIGAELRLALGEREPLGALRALASLGILAAISPRLGFDEPLARRALAELPADGLPEVLLLGCLLLPMAGEAGAAGALELLGGLEFTAGDRDRAIAAASARDLADRLAAAERPSQIRAVAAHAPPEALALAAALDGPARARAAAAARSWLGGLRGVELHIGGDDLLAAGVPSGPEIGQRLAATLDAVLDGRVGETAEAQLRAALEAQS